MPQLTAKIVAEAAGLGDKLAKEIYQICGFYLGRGLSLLIDILNPQIIILGSIYGRTQNFLDPYMYEVILQEAIFQSSAHCKIVPAGLKENIGDYAALSLADIASTKEPVNAMNDSI